MIKGFYTEIAASTTVSGQTDILHSDAKSIAVTNRHASNFVRVGFGETEELAESAAASGCPILAGQTVELQIPGAMRYASFLGDTGTVNTFVRQQ